MAENKIKTRLSLKYDTLSNWNSSTIVLNKGEAAVATVETATKDAKGNIIYVPTTLVKYGDGAKTFANLPFSSALAADVYPWAKEDKLNIAGDGTGNVVSGITWDATANGGKGGVKYTTASVATAEGLEDIQNRTADLEAEVYGENGSKDNSRIDKLEKAISDNDAAWKANTTYSFSIPISGTDKGKLLIQKIEVGGTATKVIALDFITPDELTATLANYVTLNTEQTITAKKTFDNAEICVTGDNLENSSTLPDETTIIRQGEIYLSGGENCDVTIDDTGLRVNSGGNNYIINYDDIVTTTHADNTYKKKQDPVNNPTASGNATAFIDSISQDAQGKITVTKKNITASDLGLTKVMDFLGTTTTALTDGSTTNPIKIDGKDVTANKGDVVLSGNKEFVFDGTYWKELGDQGSHALKSVTITGTEGLTGGGTLEANRTIEHAVPSGAAANTHGSYTKSWLATVTTDKFGHVTGTHSVDVAGDTEIKVDTNDDENGTVTQFSHATHAQGTAKTASTSSISGYSGTGTLKIPKLVTNAAGHVTEIKEETVTITMPAAQPIPEADGTPSLVYIDETSGKPVFTSSLKLQNSTDGTKHELIAWETPIELAKIAATGSIYDVVENSTGRFKVDKETTAKEVTYLVFDCGDAFGWGND
jgi:hypothetical protein